MLAPNASARPVLFDIQCFKRPPQWRSCAPCKPGARRAGRTWNIAVSYFAPGAREAALSRRACLGRAGLHAQACAASQTEKGRPRRTSFRTTKVYDSALCVVRFVGRGPAIACSRRMAADDTRTLQRPNRESSGSARPAQRRPAGAWPQYAGT